MPFTPHSVVEYIRANGPVVPNHLRQALGASDNFIVGAVLSELVASQKLAMTDMSYGTSKFYYDPDKPESIEDLGKHLGEKDQRAFMLIKHERVARNRDLTPLNRVAMAQIKDFAVPLKLDTPEGPEIFWRYYLVPEEEAMDIIEEKFFKHYKKVPEPVPVVVTPVSEQAPPLPQPIAASSVSEAPSADTKKPAAKKRAPRKKPTVQTIPNPEAPTSRLPPVSVAASNNFAAAIHEFFVSKKIVLVQNIASTKTEFSAMVRIPSAVGAVEYFCKAKAKKTTTDGDLASAVLESQQYKLPLLYLSAGKLTKKATDLLPGLKGAVVAALGEDGGDEE